MSFFVLLKGINCLFLPTIIYLVFFFLFQFLHLSILHLRNQQNKYAQENIFR